MRAPRGRARFVLIGAAIVVLLAAGVGLDLALGPSSHSRAGPAPAVQGRVASGGTYDLADHADRWVLVNFFASWCTDCKEELGQLVTLQRQHPGGLEVVSIDGPDDSLGAAEKLIHQAGGSWPLVDDPGALTAYGVIGLPESFLVDPSGRIADRTFGTISAAHVTAQVTAH